MEIGGFDFILNPVDSIILPAYKGSTFRGGFGNVFRRIVCALKKSDCNDCILRGKCIYSYVFETPPPAGAKIMKKYTSAPHPFVIEPPLEEKQIYKEGENLRFRLILIGKAIDYLPYFIYTFDELGKIGIGKNRGRYELKSVSVKRPFNWQDNDSNLIYDYRSKVINHFYPDVLNIEPSIENFHHNLGQPHILKEKIEPRLPIDSGKKITGLTINFITPTRIIYNGHLTIDLEFHILVRQLLRRLSMLCYFHCGTDLSMWNFKNIIKEAEGIKTVKRELKWHDWERYSARQDVRMKMGGFVGEISFEGNIEPFLSLIKAGEILHVGKGTSFGLGKYILNLGS